MIYWYDQSNIFSLTKLFVSSPNDYHVFLEYLLASNAVCVRIPSYLSSINKFIFIKSRFATIINKVWTPRLARDNCRIWICIYPSEKINLSDQTHSSHWTLTLQVFSASDEVDTDWTIKSRFDHFLSKFELKYCCLCLVVALMLICWVDMM